MTVALLLVWSLSAQEKMTLSQFETMALERHPAMAQASASIRAAEGARRQAGLYPNPNAGYSASEVNPGPIISGGEHGGFVSQRIVTGGKLGIARRIADQDIALAKAASHAERLRLLNSVRGLFYQALGEQRLLEVRGELAGLAKSAVQTTHQLANVGQADRPDVLAIEIESERLELGLVTARNALDRTWRRLAAAAGNPELARQPLEGDLEQLPALEFEQALARVFEESPDVETAKAGAARSELAVKQARAAVIPDVVARAGAHYNRERLELFQRRVGCRARRRWVSICRSSIAIRARSPRRAPMPSVPDWLFSAHGCICARGWPRPSATIRIRARRRSVTARK